MQVRDLRTGDRIEVKSVFGYVHEALHCEHGMSKIVSQLDGQEPVTRAYITTQEITSGLVVIGPYIIHERP